MNNIIPIEDQIKFGIPIDIEKGKNAKGENTYTFQGIASTPDVDTQGEVVMAKAYDLSGFKDVNWNHKAKEDANAYLGQITKHSFEKSGLKVQGELFEEMPMTHAVVNLMKALKKRGKNLQLSVEGQVLERGSKDPKNPAYKIIKSAKLTGVAITANAINQNTFCDLIEKGETPIHDWNYDESTDLILKSLDAGKILSEEEIEKAMVAGNVTGTATIDQPLTAEPLKKESLEGACNCNKSDCEKCITANKKVLSKSLVYEKIFNYFYPIDFEKANSVYSLAEKIQLMKDNTKSITQETLNKAHEILELASANVEKAAETEITSTKDEVNVNISEDLKKSIDTIQLQNEEFRNNVDLKFGAVGAILKSNNELIEALVSQNEELKKSNAELLTAISEKVTSTNDIIEKISKSPVSKTNIAALKGVERFEKSEDGVQIYNMANKEHKKALSDKLEQLSGFESKHLNGGRFNEDLMKAAGDVEMIGDFSDPQVRKWLKEVHNIQVIKQA